MDRTGWVRGGDRSAGQPMQRSGWIRAARYIAESFWRSVIVAWSRMSRIKAQGGTCRTGCMPSDSEDAATNE